MNRSRLWRGPVGDLVLALIMAACCWFCVWPGQDGYPVVSWAPETGVGLLVVARPHRLRAVSWALALATGGYLATGVPLSAALTLAALALAASRLCLVVFNRLRRTGVRPIARLLIAAGSASFAAALLELLLVAMVHHHLHAGAVRLAAVNLMGRATGLILIGCVGLLPQGTERARSRQEFPVSRLLQPVLLVVASALIFVFGSSPLTFLPVLLIVWAAVLLPLRTLQIELLLLTLLVCVASQQGLGPFGGMVDHLASPQLVRVELAEGFNLSITLVGVMLAVYVSTSRVQADALRGSALLQQEMLDASVVGMMIVSRADGPLGRSSEVTQSNVIAREMFGMVDGPVAAGVLIDRIAPQDQDLVTSSLLNVIHGGTTRETVEFWLEPRSGHWRRISATMTAMGRDHKLGPEHISFQLIDITEQDAVRRELTQRALHDPLTGLGNRTLLEDRMAYWQEINQREGTCALAVYVDLDSFKAINDTYGHETGDAVLVEVARRMQAVVRPQDTVVRLGGDEFVVLMPELPRDQPEIFDQMVARLRQAICRPMQMPWGLLPIGASLGSAVSDGATSQETLLRRADKSMYEAKSLARGIRIPAQTTSLEHGGVPPQPPALPDIGLGEIRTALRESQFELFVQPLVDLPSRRILGGEALIRWNHPTRGLLGPDQWLDLVEGSDLIGELGTWVIRESCRIAARWGEVLGAGSPVMHANVSARQLGNGNLVRDVREALEETGLVPDKLVIELTETQLDLSPAEVNNEIGALRDAGIALAADDFGTGYSSLTRLTDMPIDIMKIDRTFVGRMAEDERARAVVAAVLAMGNELGLEVVAEGVETEGQAIDLRSMGCTVAQGFLWSRAVRCEEFLRLAQEQAMTGAAR